MKHKTKIAGIALLAVTLVACTPSQIATSEQLSLILLQDIPQFIILFGTPSPGTIVTMNESVAKATEAAKLLHQAIADYQTAGPVTTSQKVHFYVGEITADLQPVLQIAGTDPKLTAGITLVLNTAQQIEAVFPVSAAKATVSASNRVKLPSPNSLKKQFNDILGY